MFAPQTSMTPMMNGMAPGTASTSGKGGGQPMTAPGPMTPPSMGQTAPMPTAPTPAPGAAPNVFDTSANLYSAAAAGPNINQFMNPYTSEVIGRTGMDMARRAAMDRGTLGAQATQARAFGGSRHGVAEGTMLGEYGRAFGDMAAQQRQQGFNTALSAAQGQQGIQGNLANLGFGFGTQLTQQQGAQGQQVQDMIQRLIDAGKGQYDTFTGAPNDALATIMAALTGSNMGQQSQTTTKKPGLFDYLTAGASIFGGL